MRMFWKIVVFIIAVSRENILIYYSGGDKFPTRYEH